MNFFLGLAAGATGVTAIVCAIDGHAWQAGGLAFLCLVSLLCEACLAIVGAAE